MILIEINLPPSTLFLSQVLTTALTYLAWYSEGYVEYEPRRNVLKLKVPNDDALKEGLSRLVNHLIQGEYGLQPQIAPIADRQRIPRSGVLREILGPLAQARRADINEALRRYVRYCSSLASYSDELGKEFSKFDPAEGYVNAGQKMTMLSCLQPEFMEAFRRLGTWGGTTSGAPYVRDIKLGLHSTVLGLIGVYLSKFYVDYQRGTTYYLLINSSSLLGYRYLQSQLLYNHRSLLRELKLRPFPSEISLLLFTILHTCGLAGQIVVTLEGGQRCDLLLYETEMQQLVKLSTFSQLLWMRSPRLAQQLLTFLRRGTREEYQGVVSRVATLLYEAISIADVDPDRAISILYDISREVNLVLDRERLRNLSFNVEELIDVFQDFITLSSRGLSLL